MTISPKYITTSEAAARLGTYNAYLWSLVGRKLTPPIRAGAKRCYWLSSEVDALAAEKHAINQILST